MTTEQRILHRLASGARVIQERGGVSLDLAGQSMMWTRQDFYERATASQKPAEAGVGEGVLRGYGPPPSADLEAFLALAGNRA